MAFSLKKTDPIKDQYEAFTVEKLSNGVVKLTLSQPKTFNSQTIQ